MFVRQLASENKIMAYLRYAIGEIFLVVIGILIALQVNNWNENRKLKKTGNHLFYKYLSIDLKKSNTAFHGQSIIQQSFEDIIIDD